MKKSTTFLAVALPIATIGASVYALIKATNKYDEGYIEIPLSVKKGTSTNDSV